MAAILRSWRMYAGVLLLAVALVAADPAARPANAAVCTSTAGVTVVVDYGALGGGVVVACDPTDPATGIAALQGAGFTVTGTKRYGLAFVCRINGKPNATQDPCVVTPPATKYWSYWHAARHGTWSFSTVGATSYNPAPNTVEGWAYGAGTAPHISPP